MMIFCPVSCLAGVVLNVRLATLFLGGGVEVDLPLASINFSRAELVGVGGLL